MRCPSCSAEAPGGSRFCASCGKALASSSAGTSSEVPTRLSPDSRRPRPSSGSRAGLQSSDSLADARFLPGVTLAERYRIIGLLGKGGMGEVYRADDLKLGQAVALKFLPESLGEDPGRVQRFFNEVRMARQVTHPNVCRVYDIGEVEGHHYISMEYVDGEDRSTLLKRIGYLPKDKAVQIARQLCAGLAAAHDRDILHRDLKPANVMLDGRGHVRITDCFFFLIVFSHIPELSFSAWYAGSTGTILLLMSAVLVYAFFTSLAGRSLFAESMVPQE